MSPLPTEQKSSKRLVGFFFFFNLQERCPGVSLWTPEQSLCIPGGPSAAPWLAFSCCGCGTYSYCSLVAPGLGKAGSPHPWHRGCSGPASGLPHSGTPGPGIVGVIAPGSSLPTPGGGSPTRWHLVPSSHGGWTVPGTAGGGVLGFFLPRVWCDRPGLQPPGTADGHLHLALGCFPAWEKVFPEQGTSCWRFWRINEIGSLSPNTP